MIKKIGLYSLEALLVGGLVYLFWYIMSPPETWITTVCTIAVWTMSLTIIVFASGMLYTLKGGFTDTEKAALDQMIPLSIIIMDISAGIGCGFILFTYAFYYTGIIYAIAWALFISLILRYRFSEPRIQLPEIEDTELIRYLLDKWEDCEFAYVADAVTELDKKTVIEFTSKLAKYYGANEVRVLVKLIP